MTYFFFNEMSWFLWKLKNKTENKHKYTNWGGFKNWKTDLYFFFRYYFSNFISHIHFFLKNFLKIRNLNFCFLLNMIFYLFFILNIFFIFLFLLKITLNAPDRNFFLDLFLFFYLVVKSLGLITMAIGVHILCRREDLFCF